MEIKKENLSKLLEKSLITISELDSRALIEGKKTLCPAAFELLQAAWDLMKEKEHITQLPKLKISSINADALRIISLEGINCCGKTTQALGLRDKMKKINPYIPPRFYECVPSSIIKSKSQGNFYQMYNPVVDSLLIASAYLDKIDRLIKKKKSFIITDRSIDSLYVFQGHKLLQMGYSIDQSINWLMSLAKPADIDELRFYLNISIDEAAKRSNIRREKSSQHELSPEDLKELSDSQTMYSILRNEFNRDYIWIDGTKSITEITNNLMNHVVKKFGDKFL